MPRNEKQTLTLYGSPTGGNFQLEFSGQTTGNIAYNASAATIQTALEALSNIAPGDVDVTGGSLPGTPVVVEFQGAYAATKVPSLRVLATGLTGGTIYADVTTITEGESAGPGSEISHFWTFNESSSPNYDSVGSLDLDWGASGDGVVSSEAGIHGGAISLGGTTPSNSWAADASGSASGFGDTDFTVCGFFKGSLPTPSNTFFQFSVYNSSLLIDLDSSSRVKATFSISYPSVNAVSVTATTYGPSSWSSWSFVVVQWISSTKTLKISVEDGAFDSTVGTGSFPASGGTPSAAFYGPNGIVYVDSWGIWRRALTATEITQLYGGAQPPFGSGTNEVQRLTIYGSPSRGSVELGPAGYPAVIPYDSTAGETQALLEVLTPIETGNVTVTGGDLPGSYVEMEFVGALGSTDIDEMTVDDSNIKSGVEESQEASGCPNAIQVIDYDGASATTGTFTLTFGGDETAALDFDASAAEIESALEALSSVGTGNVSASGGPLNSSPVTVEFIDELGAVRHSRMTVDDAGLDGDLVVSASSYGGCGGAFMLLGVG